VRFTYDATPGTARISQIKTLFKESFFYLKFWYKCGSFSSSQNFGIRIRDSAANVYLQDNYTWSATINDIAIPSCDTWTYYELKFLSHPDYSSYFVGLGNGNTITSGYVVVDDIELDLDTTFVAMKATGHNDAQYIADILNDNINISTGYAERGVFQGSGYSVQLADPWITVEGVAYRHYLNILNDFITGKVSGISAIARDASGAVISRDNLTNAIDMQGYIELTFSKAFGELKKGNYAPPIITEDMFPDAPYSSIGMHINHFAGTFMVNNAGAGKGERNYLKCYRICDCTGSDPAEYLIGKSIQNIVAFSGSQDFQHVFDPDGNEILASKCTLVTPTGTTGAEQYHYVNVDFSIANHEYALVHFKYSACSAQTMIEEIGELLFPNYPFNTVDIDLFSSGRNYNVTNGGLQDHRDPHFVINNRIEYLKILEDICKNFNFNYVVDDDSEIIFKIYDYQAPWNPGETTTINDDMAESFEFLRKNSEYDKMINRLNSAFGYDGSESNQKSYIFEMPESQKSQSLIKDESYEMPYFAADMAVSRRFAWSTAKTMMIESFSPPKNYIFRILKIDDRFDDNNTIADILEPYKILKFKHTIFGDSDYHYMRIYRITREIPDNTAVVEFIDVTELSLVDANATCLLQSNTEDESLIILDRAALGFHLIYNNGSGVKHSDSKFLFSKTSLTNATSTPDLQIGPFGYRSNLHIFGALATNGIASATMSFWINFDAIGNQEMIVAQYESASKYWYIYKAADNRVRLYVYNGSVKLNIVTTSTLSANKWHHIVFYRTDDDAGLYLDGAQEAYSSNSLNEIFNDEFHVFNDANSGNYMSAAIQDLRFEFTPTGITERTEGWFDLAPVVGLTDTYVVPWGLHSVYWRQYWTDFS
jgi:hypothetical protein